MSDWEPLDERLVQEHEEYLVSQLEDIVRHLGAHAPELVEAPVVYRNRETGSVVYAMEGSLYALRDGAGVRYRPVTEGMIEMMARREGELVGSAVVPEGSIFPGGAPEPV